MRFYRTSSKGVSINKSGEKDKTLWNGEKNTKKVVR